MIYIVTAIYDEAQPFITRFQLKKECSHTRFQVFLNREAGLCLIISGIGSVPAAVAVSSICTEYGAGRGDFLLNVGICAQIQTGREAACQTINPCRTGQLFLCNKITEQTTGRTFYPDLLYRHRFAEAQVITGAKPFRKAVPLTATAYPASNGKLPSTGQSEKTASAITDPSGAICLYDMEAAAIYQAGSYYFGPHQMSFLKIVSDDGSPENVTAEQIGRLVHETMKSIADHITTLQTILREEPWNGDPSLEQLCIDLHCSRAMSESLRQHIRYCILSDVDYISVLNEMYREGKLPCKDKREGKQRFEELKERLL